MTPVSTSQVLRESSAYLLSYIRVGEGRSQVGTTPQANGHSVNGQTPQGKKRRDRDSEDDDDEAPVKKSQLQDPASSPAYAPSDDEEEEEVERTPRNWKYKGRDDIPAPRANVPDLLKQSPTDRPSHPSPGGSRAERRREKRKRSKGAPNPYKFGASPSTSRREQQQQTAGGFRRNGLGKGMKPRKATSGRASFRG